MIIKLAPQRRDDTLSVIKTCKVFTVNGEDFDFTRMANGDTLPRTAINSEWFAGSVGLNDDELTLTLLLPLLGNYSPEQAFPADLTSVHDGPVVFPQPLPE